MRLALCISSVAVSLVASVSAQTLSNYQAVVSSQSPSNYFKLDGSLESAVNGSVVLEINELLTANGGFASDVFRNPTNSYFFDAGQNNAWLRNLTDPLINGGGTADTNATNKGSITFLFRALAGTNIGGQRFLFDATTTGGMGTTNHNALSLYFENDTSTNNPNSLKLLFGDSTTIVLPASNVLYGTWYYFALTYDESRKPNKAVWYLGPAGRVLSTGMTTNSDDAVAGEGTGLYIGQRASFGGAFRNPGSGRIDEFAIWARELSSTEISNQFAALPQPAPPGATYQQVIESQIPKYYFKLDNSFTESVGGVLEFTTNGVGGAFTGDFLGNANFAYSFLETNDALYITNDLINGGGPGQNTEATGTGTISFLFRMLSDTNYQGQRFIFSAPGSEATSTSDNQLGLFLENSATTNPHPGSLKLRVGNTTKGSIGSSWPDNNIPVAFATNLVTNAWYYFAMTYDEGRNTTEVQVYFGRAGETLTTSTMNPANNAVVGDNGWLVLGNKIETNTIVDNAFRNPGEGVIDEFAIWHDELTPTEIQAQFAAVVAPVATPTLTIARSGSDVIMSWPVDGSAGFDLESSVSLTSPSWTGAGSPFVVGTNNVVTNAISGNTRFYRLHKP